MTKVILNQPVYGLGEEGDICQVKDGYARNFLFPKGMAGPHTKHNLEILKQKQKNIARRKAVRLAEAQELKSKIEACHLIFRLKMAAEGRAFGSISNADVAAALLAKEITVERRSIEVPHGHIKTQGEHEVRIRLYEGVMANITIQVEAEIIKH
jgi:large subunit ribosomal protein L9